MESKNSTLTNNVNQQTQIRINTNLLTQLLYIYIYIYYELATRSFTYKILILTTLIVTRYFTYDPRMNYTLQNVLYCKKNQKCSKTSVWVVHVVCMRNSFLGLFPDIDADIPRIFLLFFSHGPSLYMCSRCVLIFVSLVFSMNTYLSDFGTLTLSHRYTTPRLNYVHSHIFSLIVLLILTLTL